MPASDILKQVLEQRPVRVTDENEDKRRVLNPTETAAAQEKAQLLQERFSEWVWEEPERANCLIDEYNRRFNSIVLRDYSTEGERLTLPGMAKDFSPRPHQRAAVARMLSEPAVGLFHQVGGGKDRRDGHGRDGTAPTGHGQQARRYRPEPHARTVRSGMATALSAGADPRRLIG